MGTLGGGDGWGDGLDDWGLVCGFDGGEDLGAFGFAAGASHDFIELLF